MGTKVSNKQNIKNIGEYMHIVDSYLQLTSMPLSIRNFQKIKDEQSAINSAINNASLYIIAKREQPKIVVPKNKPVYEDSEKIIIPLDIIMMETGVEVHALYMLPSIPNHSNMNSYRKTLTETEFDGLFYCASNGYGQMLFKPCDNLFELFTYEVLYVGQCVDEPLTKRFRAHHALQDMLTNEEVISKDYDKSEELILMPFTSEGEVISLLNPSNSTDEDYEKAFMNNFSFGSKDIIKDCEKALVHGMNPKYNKIRFKNYPVSDDGLYRTEADVYAYYIRENIRLRYDGGIIIGGFDDMNVSRIIGDREGYTNIYGPGEDYTEKYNDQMFPSVD